MSTIPPLIRSESMTEQVADLLLVCAGGLPTPSTTSVPQANISVVLNTAVTSRILGPGNLSDALLIVDDAPGAQLACGFAAGCTFPGTSTVAGVAGPEPYSGSPGPPARPNIYAGVVLGNMVTFFGVPVDPPGNTGSRTFRITNLRVNASALPPMMPGVVQVTASIASPFAVQNPEQTVGFGVKSFAFSLRTPDNQGPLAGPQNVPACTSLDKTQPAATLRFTELMTTASRLRTIAAPIDIDTSPPPVPQNVAGTVYNTESGFYNPLLAGPDGVLSTAGLADSGTRLKVTFRNIPPGMGVWVTTTNLNPTVSKQARLVAAESLPFAPLPKTGTFFADMRQLAVTDGTASAVWEVLATNLFAVEPLDFGLSFGGVANPAAAATVTVEGSLAPAASAASIPGFADQGEELGLLQTAPCSSSTSVSIAIKPESNSAGPAVINPRSNGVIPVAVLSSATFHAPGQVDRSSLTFGRTGNEPSLASCAKNGQDINGDGRPDLMCHFRTELTGLVRGDKAAVLKGATISGTPFTASAPIRTVP